MRGFVSISTALAAWRAISPMSAKGLPLCGVPKNTMSAVLFRISSNSGLLEVEQIAKV